MYQNKVIRGGGYSESINMLRFPLTILVVFVHGFGADIDVSELHASGLTGLALYDYIRLFFSVVIARSAVPIFFIISGYLLFRKVEEYSKQVYVGKLKKRWHSLVIPYPHGTCSSCSGLWRSSWVAYSCMASHGADSAIISFRMVGCTCFGTAAYGMSGLLGSEWRPTTAVLCSCLSGI